MTKTQINVAFKIIGAIIFTGLLACLWLVRYKIIYGAPIDRTTLEVIRNIAAGDIIAMVTISLLVFAEFRKA